ncbi:MAG: SDR family NAD(P)-dependent oxidoreductase [Alphaproteobacteria bacterium]|nr:SDR family NAD(P)-dependent oxidoreductase [Alphaproteobacteria bacterium]
MASGHGLTALVTGASAGIGKAFAEVFAKNGFDLILTARREERLAALAAELESRHGIKVTVIAKDLADPTGAERLVAEIKTSGLKVDALVNNAGYGVPANYDGTSWSTQRDFIQVLVTAPCELVHRLLPDMVARKKGYIINVASVAGMIPGAASSTLYGAAKSFMVQFSRSLHLEQEANGVHVTALCPGFTYSEFHDVTGNREQVSKMPSYMWMTSENVAQEGYDAVMRNKVVHVNGPVNKGIVLLAKYLPDQVGLMIMRARSRGER